MSSEAAQKAGGGAMSTRDEAVAAVVQALGGEAIIDPIPAGMAVDALIAEGWRKKPSREEVAAVIREVAGVRTWNVEETAEAILALMDRGQ